MDSDLLASLDQKFRSTIAPPFTESLRRGSIYNPVLSELCDVGKVEEIRAAARTRPTWWRKPALLL